jgi:hypothetical protein
MEYVTSAILGVALAASCGFRVFVPLLVAAGAAHVGWLSLAPDQAWLGSTPALVVLSVAAVVEVVAMHVPWLDHALDVVASPAAIIAGTLLSASQLGELDPIVRWTAAAVAGGGAAAAVQATTVAVRATSTALTGGIANPIVAFAEAAAALFFALLAVLVPVLALGLLLLLGVLAAQKVRQRLAA